MQDSLFSPTWYRIAKLKPRLRKHARIHRHSYRGELWFVLQNQTSGQYYRFTPVVFHIIGLMNGERNVQELWDLAMERFGDEAPTQGDMVNVLSQLYAADVLVSDVPPDIEDLLRRHERHSRGKWLTNLRTPLALRFPLLDPEKFLAATIRYVRPVFSPAGAAIWLFVVMMAIVTAFRQWPELTGNITDRILSAQNLFLMWITYPFVKALHEFGHGYAVKRWGGEVHEMGIMLLVLMPIPYVDASSSTAYPEKRRRILVGAAGIMVELFIASLALFLWVNLEPGMARSAAFNVVLIGSISAVLFNGNPLLRYDGYYIFSDLIEVPNLAQRSSNYLAHILKKYLFGLKNLDEPYVGPGERPWLLTYSVAAFIYRVFIYTSIILFIAGKFYAIGILLAIWAVFSMIVLPFLKRIYFLAASPVLRRKRLRAILTTSVIVGFLVFLLFYAPFPHRTRAEGVVWVAEESLVRSGTSSFVLELAAEPDGPVKKGDLLILCADPQLAAHVRILEARMRGLEALYDSQRYSNRVQARVTREEMETVQADLSRARERLAELEIKSPTDGIFVLPDASDLPGRYIKQGDLVGFVLDAGKPVVRVVIPQADVDLIRNQNRGVQVRLAEKIGDIITARVKREVPGALQQLPSTVLGAAGGGSIPIDPRDDRGLAALQKVFQLDIELDQETPDINVGGRAYVRFDHGTRPLGLQWYSGLRRLFIRRFHV